MAWTTNAVCRICGVLLTSKMSTIVPAIISGGDFSNLRSASVFGVAQAFQKFRSFNKSRGGMVAGLAHVGYGKPNEVFKLLAEVFGSIKAAKSDP